MRFKAVIFDLDGVLVSTDEQHYQGWKALCDRLDIPFDRETNNRFRGVSRMACVDILEENGLLLQIIALLARSAEAQPQHSKSDILFAASYMREHFHEPLDIKTCADLLHISVSWFSHLFTQVIGVSPHKYLLSLRIDKAKELLSYSSMNIAEISASVGFPDSLYFSRLFRRYTGYSPMNYRNLVSR